MAGNKAYISISRDRSVSNALRGFNLIVDDKVIDKIKSGKTKQYAVSSGQHSIRIGIDFYKSKPLEIVLRGGESLALTCGDRAPKTLGESLTLRGMGQSLKALTSPADYLYVELAGRKNAQVTKTGTAPAATPARSTRTGRRKGHSDKTLFVSYRREDSRAITGRICDRLTGHFGRHAVFRDVDSIPVGMDFRSKIRETIDRADLLIAIIGPRWLELRNPDGERRLDQPEDYVRLEIESALAKGILVIPVRVEDAPNPRADELPESIAELAYLNSMFIPPEPFFHTGVDKLIGEIEALGTGSEAAGQQFCTECGKPLMPGQRFCTGCGRPAARR